MDLVFDWHFGLAKLHRKGDIFLSGLPAISENSQDRFVQALENRIGIDNPGRAFCAITIPPSGRNPFVRGHSVALVVDKEQKTIVYQNPYGKPPPDYLVSALQKNFRDYEQICLNVPQQEDPYSCALITIMNLVAMAQDVPVDPSIDGELWSLRRRHAPHFLSIEKENFQKGRQETLDRMRQYGEVEVSESNGMEFKTDHREDLSAVNGMLTAIDKLNPHYSKLSPQLQLLIRLART